MSSNDIGRFIKFLFAQQDTDLLYYRSVYAALEAHKPSLTTVGGRMPGVGAIGFLLGGGLSSLSSRYGFGADVVSVWEVSIT